MANMMQRVMAFLRGSQANAKPRPLTPRPERNPLDDPLSRESLEAAHRYNDERYRHQVNDDQWQSKAIASRLRGCAVTQMPQAPLHHVGSFQPPAHDLDRPIWLSERKETALGYLAFGPGASHHTTFKHANSSEPRLAQLPEDTKLIEWAIEVGEPRHTTWNQILADACERAGLDGFRYRNFGALEIFIARPENLLEVEQTQDLAPTASHLSP